MDCPDVEISRALRGDVLWGDDFTPEQIRTWFEEEAHGYAGIGGGSEENLAEYQALNGATLFAHVRGRRFPTCLCLGPGRGWEMFQLSAMVDRFIAIEPERSFWAGDFGKPTEWRMPDYLGRLSIDDASIDLATTICVLHHIPNVTAVLTEVFRTLRPGGTLLLREPIVSLGDWRSPRRGVTKNERGIPEHWLLRSMADIGFEITSTTHCVFGPLRRICDGLRIAPYQSRLFTGLDIFISSITAKHCVYNRKTVLSAFAPSALSVVAIKP